LKLINIKPAYEMSVGQLCLLPRLSRRRWSE